MGVGWGILLLVAGLILVLDVIDFDTIVDDNTLGWILVVAGTLAIVLALVMDARRSRSRRAVERR